MQLKPQTGSRDVARRNDESKLFSGVLVLMNNEALPPGIQVEIVLTDRNSGE